VITDVSCVLVTRGDVDLQPVLSSLPFDDIVVWDNSVEERDLKVYGRYAAIEAAKHPLIYTQDDDALCPAGDLLAAYRLLDTGGLLVNVPPGEWPWLAWGAIFPREKPAEAFDRYLARHPFDDEFLFWADVVFAHIYGWQFVDLGHMNLPWATAPTRMYHQPDHYPGQARVRAKVAAL
jgi:SAM-dependent methyltransferase